MREMVCHSFKVGRGDDFVKLSLAAQALYYALAFNADIDGAITGAVSVCRTIGAPPDALSELVEEGFLLEVEGALFDAFWWVNNNMGAMHYERYKNHVEQLRFLEVPGKDDAPAPYRLKQVPGLGQARPGQVPGLALEGAGPVPGAGREDAGHMPGMCPEGAGPVPGTCQPNGKKRNGTSPGNEGKQVNLACEYRQGQLCPRCNAGRLLSEDEGRWLVCNTCGFDVPLSF